MVETIDPVEESAQKDFHNSLRFFSRVSSDMFNAKTMASNK